MVQELINKNVSLENGTLLPPLYWAILKDNPTIVDLLIEKGHSLGVPPNWTRISPLLFSVIYRASYDIVEGLLVNGANINFTNPGAFGCPIRSCIAARCDTDILELLLDFGVSTNDSRPYDIYYLTNFFKGSGPWLKVLIERDFLLSLEIIEFIIDIVIDSRDIEAIEIIFTMNKTKAVFDELTDR